MTLLHKEVRMLRKTNEALTKRRRTKKIHVRARGALTVEDVHSLIKQKEIVRPQLSGRSMEGDVIQTGPLGVRHCERCDKTNHNVRTCQEIEETSKEDSDIENN